jgi:hypothetical protein
MKGEIEVTEERSRMNIFEAISKTGGIMGIIFVIF